MGRAVFANCDTVMRQNVYHWQLHQCCKANSRTQVICKYEECAAEYLEAAVKRNTVHRSCHSELTNAEINVTAIVAARLELRQALQVSHRRAFQVSGAADKVRNIFG
ncbi:hypothetical protein D3C78_1169820 [compost metagenome]